MNDSDKYILVCSPMRTGSTLLYNFFNECVDGYIVKKYEISPMAFKEGVDFAPILFRHPVACIGSLLEFLNKDYNYDNIKECYHRLKHQFEWANELLDKFPKSTFKIRYENFYNNIDFLLEWSKINLNCVIDTNTFLKFKENFNINNVTTMSENNLNLFQNNHISKDRGGNENKLNKIRQTKLLYRELSEFAGEYGYEY